MRTIRGPALFLAQFAGDTAPFNDWDGITAWAASLGYVGVQVPSWDARLIDLDLAATSQDYRDQFLGVARANGVEVTERPVVGLVGIGVSAEVVRQPEEIPVASDGVVGVGGVEDRRPQECGQGVERGTRAVEGAGQVDGECVVGGDRRGVLCDGRARPIGLCRNQFDLSSCERGSDVAAVFESDDDAVDRCRDRADPRHHVGALFSSVGGHEVEDVANRLQR